MRVYLDPDVCEERILRYVDREHSYRVESLAVELFVVGFEEAVARVVFRFRGVQQHRVSGHVRRKPGNEARSSQCKRAIYSFRKKQLEWKECGN